MTTCQGTLAGETDRPVVLATVIVHHSAAPRQLHTPVCIGQVLHMGKRRTADRYKKDNTNGNQFIGRHCSLKTSEYVS